MNSWYRPTWDPRTATTLAPRNRFRFACPWRRRDDRRDPPAVLETSGLSAGNNRQAVVHDLDLTVGEGEIVALLGPNGAGKTTTLLAIAGELPCLTGSVRLQGRPAQGRLFRRVRDGLGFISDERPVIMRLSVRDNLRLRDDGVAAGLELFPELVPHLDRPVGLLSGGQQQMVVMARTLAARPRILLADELSLGLAPMVTARLLQAIVAAAGTGTGVLLVEQQVTLALDIASRAYVLQGGRVTMSGTSAEIKASADRLEMAYLGGPARQEPRDREGSA